MDGQKVPAGQDVMEPPLQKYPGKQVGEGVMTRIRWLPPSAM